MFETVQYEVTASVACLTLTLALPLGLFKA